MFLRVVLAALLLSVTLAQPATARTAAAAPTSTKEESDRLRADMEGQVERLRLNVETFMQTQDKRIGDLQFYGNMNNGLIALLAIVVTALVVYMAFNFGRSAKEEARAAVRDWLEEKAAGELKEKLREFDGKLDKMAADRLERLEAKHSEQAAPLIAELQEGCALMRESLGVFQMSRVTAKLGGGLSDVTSDPVKLRSAAAAAVAKPVAERNFNDWYVMAWVDMEEEEFDVAYRRFTKALSMGAPDILLSLKAAHYAGAAAAKLGRWDDVITQSSDVLERCGEVGEEDEAALVLTNFLRKGFALVQLRRYQEALVVYDEALMRPWDGNNSDIAIVRARVFLKRGIVLHRQGAGGEAERVYDVFIQDHNTTTSSVIKGELAAAMYNKMLLRKKAGDYIEENRLLDEIDRRFGASEEPELAGIIKSVKAAITAREAKEKKNELAEV